MAHCAIWCTAWLALFGAQCIWLDSLNMLIDFSEHSPVALFMIVSRDASSSNFFSLVLFPNGKLILR